jgi:hypothetical protein
MATTKRTPKGSTSTQPAKPVTPKGARPATCGELYEFDPKVNAAFSAEGCGRLPRHNGDHRSTLTVAKPKASRKRRTSRKAAASPKGNFRSMKSVQVYRNEVAAKVEAGEVTASEALSLVAKADDEYAAFLRRSRKARAAKRTLSAA